MNRHLTILSSPVFIFGLAAFLCCCTPAVAQTQFETPRNPGSIEKPSIPKSGKTVIRIFDNNGKPAANARVFSVDYRAQSPMRIERQHVSTNAVRQIDIHGKPVDENPDGSPYSFATANKDGRIEIDRQSAHLIFSDDENQMAFIPVGRTRNVTLHKCGVAEFDTKSKKNQKAIVIWKNNLAGSYPVLSPRVHADAEGNFRAADWRLSSYFEYLAVLNTKNNNQVVLPPGEIGVSVITDKQMRAMGFLPSVNLLDAKYCRSIPINNGIHEIKSGQFTNVTVQETTMITGVVQSDSTPDWSSDNVANGYLRFNFNAEHEFPKWTNPANVYHQLLLPKMKVLRVGSNMGIMAVSIKPNGSFSAPPMPKGTYSIRLFKPGPNETQVFKVRKKDGEAIQLGVKIVEQDEVLEIRDLGPLVALDSPVLQSDTAMVTKKTDPIFQKPEDRKQQLEYWLQFLAHSSESNSQESGRAKIHIKELLAREFDQRQSNRAMELDELDREIANARKRVFARTRRKNEIVDRRMEKLLINKPAEKKLDPDVHTTDTFHPPVASKTIHVNSPSVKGGTYLRFALVDFHRRLVKADRGQYVPLLTDKTVRDAIKKGVESFDTYYQSKPERAAGLKSFQKFKRVYLHIADTGAYPEGATFDSFNSMSDGRDVNYAGFWVRLNVKVEGKNFALPILDIAYGRLHDH